MEGEDQSCLGQCINLCPAWSGKQKEALRFNLKKATLESDMKREAWVQQQWKEHSSSCCQCTGETHIVSAKTCLFSN